MPKKTRDEDKPLKTGWALRFAHLLRDRRLELGLSQEEVARQVPMDRGLYNRYEQETGKEHRPTATTLYGLAFALQVPEELMFEWAQVRYPKVDLTASPSAPADIVKLLLELRDDFQSSLLDVNAQLAGLRSELDEVKRATRPAPSRRRQPPAEEPRGRRDRV